MKEKIQIAIACGPNSGDFLELLVYTADKLSSGKYDIEYLIGCNHSDTPVDKIESIDSKNKIHIFKAEGKDMYSGNGASIAGAHADCLDMLLPKMTSKYGIICDVDVAFLAQDWDEKLVSSLSSSHIIIGSEYRASVIGGEHHKYQGFPAAFLIAFLVEPIQKLNISFSPKYQSVRVTEDNVHIYGGQIGRLCHLDTGCELPEKIIPAGYRGLTLRTVTYSMKGSSFTSNKNLGDEFLHHGEPIATHKGRSQSRAMISEWKDAVINWINAR